jgi:hypothetical protein
MNDRIRHADEHEVGIERPAHGRWWGDGTTSTTRFEREDDQSVTQ